jgi:hypothetical protein
MFTQTDGPDKGIIPLTCSELFMRVEDKKADDPNVSFTVEVSYIEVRESFVSLPLLLLTVSADLQ